MPKKKPEPIQEVAGTVQDVPPEQKAVVKTKRVTSVSTRPLSAEEFSVAQVLDQRSKVKKLMVEAMTEGVHFGKFPGVDKPTLLQPGAQMLATTFRIGDRELEFIDRELPGDHREFMFRKEFYHLGTGQVLTEARGVCSTRESNYRYTPVKKGEEVGPVPKAYWDAPKEGTARAAILKEAYGGEGKLAPKKNEANQWVIMRFTGTGERQENPDIADEYNTCLSMADKRCYVRGMIKALGVGDLFTHDIEDGKEPDPPPEKEPPKTEEKKPEPPKNPEPTKPVTAAPAAPPAEGAAGISGPKSPGPGPATAGGKKQGVEAPKTTTPEQLQQQIQGMEASAEVKRLATLCATGLTIMKTQKYLVDEGPGQAAEWTAKVNEAYKKADVAELKKIYAELQELYKQKATKPKPAAAPPAAVGMKACKGSCGKQIPDVPGSDYCLECLKKLSIV